MTKIDDIKEAVSEEFGVAVRSMLAPIRVRKIVIARHTAMYLTREITKRSYPKIAKVFGRRDHTSIIHACEKTAERMAHDPAYAARVEKLRAALDAIPRTPRRTDSRGYMEK